jgi:hypothetical protein
MEEALTAGDLAPVVNGWARTYQLRNTGRWNDEMGIGFTGALFFALRVTWWAGNAPARAGGRCRS